MASVYEKAAQRIKGASYAVAFTGAGVSVESGIKPFRGPDGLWVAEVDPDLFTIRYFHQHPLEALRLQKQHLFDPSSSAAPNDAHRVLAELETKKLIRSVITQNIDNLHWRAGSRNVLELHGNIREMICLQCGRLYPLSTPAEGAPRCQSCGTILKPNCVLFGEPLPKSTWYRAEAELRKADLLLIIGASGAVEPAGTLPFRFCQHFQTINIDPSKNRYTGIAEINIEEKAGVAMKALEKYL